MNSFELIPTEENLIHTLEKDLLKRNKDLVRFYDLILAQEGASSIAIDGRWGSGKTFFVKQSMLLINAKNPMSDMDDEKKASIIYALPFPKKAEDVPENYDVAVYYDAWENDNDIDPVLSLVYEIIKQLGINYAFDDNSNVEDWQIRETNKTISFRMPHMKKSIRGKSLGENYDKFALEKRIAEAIAFKEKELRAEQEAMRKETLEAAEEQVFVELPVGEFVADVLEETFTMEELAEEMVETILEGEYSVTEKSKSIQRDAMSQELNYMELLAELQSQFVCLQYEFQYNLDKISDSDYEHRYKNPDYATYQANMARILDKSSYINQWTAELSKCSLFQKNLKKMYKEQIETASAEVKRIEEENKRILSKAGCYSESELWVKQQSYNVNWSLCNTLAERNRSIMAECEGIIQKYAELVRGAYGILNNDGFGNNNQVEHIAEQKAKVVLQEMHGKDFSEYGFRDACIKVGTQLQSADKDRSYERGVRIR